MSNQYPGGVISKTPVVPNSISAPGIWTLSQQAAAQNTNTWPFPRDPQFNYVTMLLHGDGSAQSLPTTGVGAGASAVVTPFNADASTNNFNVTINGDARSDNFTPYQAGYYSNNFGSNSGLTAPNNSAFKPATNDFTVEAWIFSTSTGQQVIYGDSDSGTNNGVLDLYLTSSGFLASDYWTSSSGVTTRTSTLAPTINQWNHVLVSRTGTTMYIGLNGVLQSFTAPSSYQSPATIYPTVGRLGAYSAGVGFIGFISNFRYINGTNLYSGSTYTVPTAPLTAVTNTSLLTCQSNRFIDNSTNAFTLTVNGTPSVAPAQPLTLPSSVATYGSGYFDGTTDYLTAPAATIVNFGTGDFTVDAWFYSTTTSGNRKILDNYNGNTNPNPALLLNIGGAGVVSWYSGQTAVINSSSNFVTNAWNYVTVSRVSGTTRMFLNGTQVGSASDSNNYAAGYTTVGIGGEPYSSGGASFLGYLTDVRVVKGSGVTSSTVPTSPLTAITNTQLLTTQYNGGGNNSGFKDSSQNNFVITRNGNTTQGTFTPYEANWSNYFNGSSGVTVSSTSSQFGFSGDFTWEAWVNLASLPSSGGNYSIICSRGAAASNSAFQFLIGNSSGTYQITGTISISSSDSNLIWNIPSAPSVGTWYHVAIVRSGSSVQAYWNGAAIGSAQTASGTTNTPTVNPSIGFRGGAYNDLFFNGYISNFRMVGSALYTAAFTPSITPLTAISGTRILTCQSNRFIDNSTNAFTLTAYSSPSVQSFSPFVPLVVYNPAVNGGSAYFDGTGDYLTLSSNASLGFGTGAYTVECWVYVTAAPAFSVFFAVSTGGLQFGLNSAGNIAIAEQNVDWRLESATPPVLNAWNHIAATRDSSSATKLFLNGAQIASNTNTTNFAQGTTGNINLNPGNANKFTGYMTDLRVVKGTALYTTSFTPSTVPLTPTAGTSLLLSNTNAAILDNAMMNVLETVPSAQISTTVTKFGAASMKFDGDTDYVGMPKNENVNLGSGNFTIEFWAYWNAFGSDKKYVLSVTNGSNYWQFNHDSSVGVGFLVNGSTIASQGSNSGWSTATWYHVALVRNGSTITIYRNGTSVASGSIGTGALSNYNNFCIGGSAGFPSTTMDGYIDEFRLTRGVARYTTTFTPPTAAFPNG